jgi:DNA-directed RNA polymerase subunit M/transcription elongation factor TFIIS
MVKISDFYNDLKPTTLAYDPFYTDPDYNNMRRLKLILLSSALGNSKLYKQLRFDDKMNYIMLIENSCLNEAIRKAHEYDIRCTWDDFQFEQIYHSICYNILSTIDTTLETSSTELVEKIFTDRIDLSTIAKLSCKELCPEKYEEVTKKIEERSNMEQNIKYTELYFCRKCKRNKATAERVQNRSNDEGSSFHITCLFCHNKWFGG